jgi:hypothetical protein
LFGLVFKLVGRCVYFVKLFAGGQNTSQLLIHRDGFIDLPLAYLFLLASLRSSKRVIRFGFELNSLTFALPQDCGGDLGTVI